VPPAKRSGTQGYWTQIEAYIRDRSEAEFSHGICPECAGKLYPEISKKVLSRVTTDDRGKVRAEGRGELLLPDKS